jgi:hypothetical protein
VVTLAVHPAKVAAVAAWVDAAWGRGGTQPPIPSAAGDGPGCGKSAALRAVAAARSLPVVEWVPPGGPTWDEARHAGVTATRYESRVGRLCRVCGGGRPWAGWR